MRDQVRFHMDAAGEHISEELFGELRIAAEKVLHGLLLHAHDGAAQERNRGGAAYCLTGQAAFAQEAAFGKDGNDYPPAISGNSEFHLATLDIEDCIRRLSLQENGIIGPILVRVLPAESLVN